MNDISLIRKNEIINLIKNKYPNMTKKQIEEKALEYDSFLSKKEILSSVNVANALISSKDINKAMNDIEFDIMTLFAYINIIEKSSISNLNKKYEYLNKVNTNLKVCIDTLNELEKQAILKNSKSIIEENFNTSKNFDVNSDLYVDRYNSAFQKDVICTYDKDCKELILPKLRNNNMICSNNIISAKVYINRQFNSINAHNINEIENILNDDNTLGWECEILSDYPIQIDENTRHYNINNGALCEITINLDSASLVNEIKLFPLSKYPFEILQIKYTQYSNPNSDSDYKYIDIDQFSLTDNYSIKFSPKLIKSLHIVLNQTNYIRDYFNYNTADYINNKIYNTLKSDRFKINYNKNIINKPNYIDREKDNQSFFIDSVLKTENITDPLKLLINEYTKKAIKYQYKYGFNKIEINNVEYDSKGIFVSNIIKTNNPIKNIKIETNEQHGYVNSDNNDKCITDIEYYISYSDNPSWKDWQPILPDNIATIQCEKLQMYNDIFPLRFKCKASDIDNVWCNDIKLVCDIDYFLLEEDGYVYALSIPRYLMNNVYTVKYTPSKEILSNEPHVSSSIAREEYLCDDTCAVSVNNIIDVNKPIVVTAININTGKQKTILKNEYSIENNSIYFNKSFSNDFKIRISYNYEICSFRIKAILRRNSKFYKYITPILKSIKYEIEAK